MLQNGLGFVVLAAAVVPQLLLLTKARTHFDETQKFYESLVAARLHHREKKWDYVESYRHLREHGNAVSIVLLEIALGVILASMKTDSEFVTALVVWLIPAAYSWVVGSRLEKTMAEGRLHIP
jgi:hypothetical protein